MTSSPPEIIKEVLALRVTQTLADPSLNPAAVLLVLYLKDGQYCILLHKRSEQVEYHKGEISFPGGTQDQEDRCAVRHHLIRILHRLISPERLAHHCP